MLFTSHTKNNGTSPVGVSYAVADVAPELGRVSRDSRLTVRRDFIGRGEEERARGALASSS